MPIIPEPFVVDDPGHDGGHDALHAALCEQRLKYRLLEELSAGPPGRQSHRREAMRRIAERFPGALREWESLTTGDLAARRAGVEALCLEDQELLPVRLGSIELRWLRLAMLVHTRLRDALVARRLAPSALVAPTGRRLSSSIHEEVARAEGLPVEELKAQLFPSARARTRRTLEPQEPR